MQGTCTLPVHDRVLAILHATNDGNDLAPRDLSLTELAVNQNLSEKGAAAFDKLYSDVCVQRCYDASKVWFLDLDNVTRDHAGYIRWRGVPVEHFTFSSGEKTRKETERLQSACQTMERFGLEVPSAAVYLLWLRVMAPPSALPCGMQPQGSVEDFMRCVRHERYRRNEAYELERRATAEHAVQAMNRALQIHGGGHLDITLWYEPGCDLMLALMLHRKEQDATAQLDTLRAQLVQSGDTEACRLILRTVTTDDAEPRLGVLVPAGALQRNEEAPHALDRLVQVLAGLHMVG
jgi:hypothetical protein